MRTAPILLLMFSLLVQTTQAQQTPFNRGVNLTNWFQVNSPAQIQFSKYTKTDFENIKSLGCDVIRLPVNLHFMTDGAPDYTLDPLFLNFLDEAVNWAEELELHLILDNHTFNPAENTDPNVGSILEKVWLQMATHYQNAYENLYYEVLNEPHGIDDALWNAIQQDVVETIRTVDDTHTIIVGGAGWNSYNNLAAMPIYEDDNLIYTFHFYDPFLFTHQGATWVAPSMAPLANVPFPYNAANMPDLPPSLAGTWVGNAFNNYDADGTIAQIQELIDIAVQFRDERNVPVYCGEFGVYIPNSQNADRVFWYDEVRSYLEEKEISWTIWDYHGGFGIFEAGGGNLFDHDLNVELLEALGFDVPPQTPFTLVPDSTGFFIYRDYIENQIIEAGYTTGALSFYSEAQPNNDEYCISWFNPEQYNAIGFDFQPDRDLSYLVDQDFALDFFVRGDLPSTTFDIRFVDTDTQDPNDRPWRTRITFDNDLAPADLYWHHIHIPLADFVEHGAWENNTWYEPQGDFDWKAIDRLEIVSEHQALTNATLWFDHIQITDLDTAIVNDTSLYNPTPIIELGLDNRVTIFPNPSSDKLYLQATGRTTFDYELLDINGRVLQSGTFNDTAELDLSPFTDGMYLLRLIDDQNQPKIAKILKME